jgi:hypothetical protein
MSFDHRHVVIVSPLGILRRQGIGALSSEAPGDIDVALAIRTLSTPTSPELPPVLDEWLAVLVFETAAESIADAVAEELEAVRRLLTAPPWIDKWLMRKLWRQWIGAPLPSLLAKRPGRVTMLLRGSRHDLSRVLGHITPMGIRSLSHADESVYAAVDLGRTEDGVR